MRIGELATASDVSRDTIRYYAKAGLLNGAVSGRTDNSYRVYAREAVDTFAFIKQGKMRGFTLREIKQALTEWHSVTPRQALAYIDTRLADLDVRIAQFHAFKRYLTLKRRRLARRT